MTAPDVHEVAAALHTSLGMFVRRLRQLKAEGSLTLPESSALARLSRQGPATLGELARLEQISPQSMGATVAALEARGLVARRADPDDGRRAVLSVSPAGEATLRDRRDERTELLAKVLADGFTARELSQLAAAAPLIQRLAERF